jgi:hypothetical protein
MFFCEKDRIVILSSCLRTDHVHGIYTGYDPNHSCSLFFRSLIMAGVTVPIQLMHCWACCRVVVCPEAVELFKFVNEEVG